MKRTIALLACTLVTSNIYASDTAKPHPTIKQISIDNSQVPTQHELSVIHFILKNTREDNIHKMRGAKGNKIYIHQDGQREAVFDKNDKVVTNYNKASYNYYDYKKYPIKHFNLDISPWLSWEL